MTTTTTTTTITIAPTEPKTINNRLFKPRITLPENNFQYTNNALLSPHYNLHRSLDNPRPMLHSHHSFDACRLPTLDKLDQYILNKNSNMTVEPVTFTADYNKSDTKSIRSFSGSKKKKYSKKSTHVSLTDIFANNLSEAVSDVDDSNEDGYVYNNTTVLTPPILNEAQKSYFSNDYHIKRPRLRSTISELPTSSKGYHVQLYKHYLSSSDEDEENSPLLYKRKKRYSIMNSSFIRNPKIISWLSIISSFSAIVCLCMMLF